MSKHMKPPYVVADYRPGGELCIESCPDAMLIADMETKNCSDDEALATAEFLVRCVNSHAKLLAACKELLVWPILATDGLDTPHAALSAVADVRTGT